MSPFTFPSSFAATLNRTFGDLPPHSQTRIMRGIAELTTGGSALDFGEIAYALDTIGDALPLNMQNGLEAFITLGRRFGPEGIDNDQIEHFAKLSKSIGNLMSNLPHNSNAARHVMSDLVDVAARLKSFDESAEGGIEALANLLEETSEFASPQIMDMFADSFRNMKTGGNSWNFLKGRIYEFEAFVDGLKRGNLTPDDLVAYELIDGQNLRMWTDLDIIDPRQKIAWEVKWSSDTTFKKVGLPALAKKLKKQMDRAELVPQYAGYRIGFVTQGGMPEAFEEGSELQQFFAAELAEAFDLDDPDEAWGLFLSATDDLSLVGNLESRFKLLNPI